MATTVTANNISSIQLKDIKYNIKSIPFSGTQSDWEQSDYIPKKSEIVLYEYEDGVVNVRIGDGVSTVNSLTDIIPVDTDTTYEFSIDEANNLLVIKDVKTGETTELQLPSGGSGNSVEVDETLTVEGAAADAKTVGDWMNNIILSSNNYGSTAPEDGQEGQVFFVEDTEPTDITLTIEGAAADAKATGDAINAIGIQSYPVGSIYMSTTNTSPASFIGGTWEQIKDKFLLAAGDTYAAGGTGGESTHILTINEIPLHKHDVNVYYDYPASTTVPATCGMISNTNLNWSASAREGKHYAGYGYTTTTGGGKSHNNLPPYLTVYMWQRIS